MPKSELKTAYTKGRVNAERYTTWRTNLSDFADSERFFLTKEYIKPNTSILDIGGAAGGLGNAIRHEVEANISYTVIDPDPSCLDYGKKNFSEFQFIEGYFPLHAPALKYDIVVMMGLFPQLPEWKKTLLDMAAFSKKYILFSLLIKLHGTTVVDKDVSYFYYFDSGERVHQVIHNIYEFVNFCSIHEMRVKQINFYGYHVAKNVRSNRCIPNREQIRGVALLELFDENEYPGRISDGGAPKEMLEKYGVKAFAPEVNIIIDGEVFDLV